MARYLDNIITRFKRQEAKGLNKYGQILEDNPRGVLEALEYLAEELTDGLMYVEEAIEKIKQKDEDPDKKTYLTWEIWKDAQKLLGKKFKLVGHMLPRDGDFKLGDVAIVTEYHEIYGLGSEKHARIRIQDLTGYEEWELILEPVTWEEALEAWSKGNAITYKNKEYGLKLRFPPDLTNIEKGHELFPFMLTEGEWHIKD